MSSLGLSIGLKALRAAQTALETIGHNVANANTPGYSRQRVDLSASPSLLLGGHSVGSGVDAGAILRIADELVVRRIAQQRGVLGMLGARVDGLGEIETLFGEPGSSGLGALLDGVFSKASSLAADPTDLVLRTGFVRANDDLAARFHELSSGIANVRQDAALRVGAEIDRANELSGEIARLNVEIGRVEASGAHANDLRDARDEALASLGDLLDVRAVEDASGRVSVTVGGRLVVGPAQSYTLDSRRVANGDVSVTIAGQDATSSIRGGSIGGWLRVANESANGVASKLDALAKTLIFEANKAHAAGVPTGGPFSRLESAYALSDTDGDGEIADELVANAGLPFDVKSGELWVQVTDRSSNRVRAERLEIDAERTTVGDLLETLSGVDHLNASIDASGKLEIHADSGFGFDFARRVAPRPDLDGTFGGSAASIATSASGPFDLSSANTLSITGPASTFTVAFASGDFEDASRANASEIADVLNANADFVANGLRAHVVAGALAIRTQDVGPAESFTIGGGSALAEFGWSAGQTISGSSTSVDVTSSGEYTGSTNGTLSFRPNMDGVIGTTPGLAIQVFDSSGSLVKTLDVGAGYVPGAALDIGDGVRLGFGLGSVSASDHDVFALHLVADSDTSDVAAALGLNALFVGTNASDIELRADIIEDPSLLSLSGNGADGDASALDDFLALKSGGLEALGGASIPDAYSNAVSSLGFEVASSRNSLDTESFLLDSLQARRDSVSGVDVDQELVDMVAFEQAYAAAGRYLQVINQLQQELLQIV